MSDDVNATCEKWVNQFMSIMEQYIPTCFLRSRHNLPWLTKPLLKLINYYSKEPSLQETSGSIKSIETEHLPNFELRKKHTSGNSTLEIPKVSGKLSFLSKGPQSVSTLVQGGTMAATDCDKANLLNSFFYSCFNTSPSTYYVPWNPRRCVSGGISLH